jgi:tetratricopeptide (TPR) repeat protein
MSATFGRLTNALAAIDLQLQLKPDDPATLVNKGVFSLHLRQFQDAIPPLTQAIALQTNNHNAQLFRAVAYLNCERLDEAQKDYECLQKIFPKAIEVNGGLGEVAARKGDTNAAIRYFELALADSTPGSDQARYFSERLKSLKPSP